MVYTDVIIIINVSCLLYVRTLLDATNCVYLKPLVSVMGRHDSSFSFVSQLHFTIILPYLCQMLTIWICIFFSDRCVSVPAI